jgi:uncharacterized repeat protein (TIGR01451 family)
MCRFVPEKILYADAKTIVFPGQFSVDGGNTWVQSDSIENESFFLALPPTGTDTSATVVSCNSETGDVYAYQEPNKTFVKIGTLPDTIIHSTPIILQLWKEKISPVGHCFGNIGNSYFVTKDKFKTWQPLVIPIYGGYPQFLPNGDFYTKAFVGPNTTDFVIVLFSMAEHKVIDTIPINPPNANFIHAIQTSQDGHLFMKTDTKWYHWTGNNWEFLPDMPSNLTSEFISNRNGVLLSPTFSASFDYGKSWSYLSDIALTNTDDTGVRHPKTVNLYCTRDGYIYAPFIGAPTQRILDPIAYRNTIKGTTWLDQNNNCEKETSESPRQGVFVKAESTSYLFTSSTSTSSGQYTLSVPAGQYVVNAIPPSPLYAGCKPDTTISFGQTTATTITFQAPIKAVESCAYLQLNGGTPFLRRCFDNSYTICYANQGTVAATNAQVTITLDSFFVFQNASIPYTKVSEFVFQFQVGNLAVDQKGSFTIAFNLSCDATLGQSHCITGEITPHQCQTVLPSIWLFNQCQANRGSFDPNDKKAFIRGSDSLQYIMAGDEIEYLIRFQNTGTDTAFKVSVLDYISEAHEISTLRPIASSHPYTWSVNENRIANFLFQPIALPDSATNLAGSQGFIKFRVKLCSDLLPQAVVTNQASIYFDFNAPINTNITQLTSRVNDLPPTPKGQIFTYPNPWSEFTVIEMPEPSTKYHLEVFDISGKRVLTEPFSGQRHELHRDKLNEGYYFFRVLKNGKTAGFGKFVVF